MGRSLPKVLILLFVISCCSSVAFADLIGVGELTYDALPASTFDITNLTGTNSAIDPVDFPITTQLTITVTSLVVNQQVGAPITILGSDFTCRTRKATWLAPLRATPVPEAAIYRLTP